jgi:hypothetical protein
MTFLLIAAIILFCAAFADGFTTWYGVKNDSLVEENPLFVWMYGTNKPGALDEFLYGSLLVGGEIAFAWALVHHHVMASWVWPSILIGQAFWHVYAAIGNYKLIKEAK